MCLLNNTDGWRYRCPNNHVNITLINAGCRMTGQRGIPAEWKKVVHYRCRTCGLRFKTPIDALQVNL